jgi:hypothetical protein
MIADTISLLSSPLLVGDKKVSTIEGLSSIYNLRLDVWQRFHFDDHPPSTPHLATQHVIFGLNLTESVDIIITTHLNLLVKAFLQQAPQHDQEKLLEFLLDSFRTYFTALCLLEKNDPLIPAVLIGSHRLFESLKMLPSFNKLLQTNLRPTIPQPHGPHDVMEHFAFAAHDVATQPAINTPTFSDTFIDVVSSALSVFQSLHPQRFLFSITTKPFAFMASAQFQPTKEGIIELGNYLSNYRATRTTHRTHPELPAFVTEIHLGFSHPTSRTFEAASATYLSIAKDLRATFLREHGEDARPAPVEFHTPFVDGNDLSPQIFSAAFFDVEKSEIDFRNMFQNTHPFLRAMTIFHSSYIPTEEELQTGLSDVDFYGLSTLFKEREAELRVRMDRHLLCGLLDACEVSPHHESCHAGACPL